MNNNFSTLRFSRLFNKHITEHVKGYVLFTLLLFGIMFISYGFFVSMNLKGNFKGTGIQEIIFGSCLFLGCVAFTSSFYTFFMHPAKSIHWLQLPASQAEKFLLSFIVTQVLFFIVFLGCFYINDLIFTSFYNQFHVVPSHANAESSSRYHADIFDLSSYSAKNILLLYVLLAPLAHFGSLLFTKNVFVKTALLVIIVMFTYVLGNFYFLKMLIPVKGMMPKGAFFNEGFRIDQDLGNTLHVDLPVTWLNTVTWLLPVVAITGVWLAGFYKLKEKQL